MRRYVILRHEMPANSPRGLHWDLMLEAGGVLETWALCAEPALGCEMAAERLADHRLAYLEYEGPIQGNRGSVVRWDWGQYEILDAPIQSTGLASSTRERWLRLSGQRFSAVAGLCAENAADQRWIFTLKAG